MLCREGSDTQQPREKLQTTERTQNVPPLDMLLWHIDDFELKVLEKWQMQEGLSELPLSTSKQVIKFPLRKMPSLHQKENILITRDWESMPRWTRTNKPAQITLIFQQSLHVFPSHSPQRTAPAQGPLSCPIPTIYHSLYKNKRR